MTDEEAMRLALLQAQENVGEDEVPVGAVIVRGDEVIAVSRNAREHGKNALYHAEIRAIDEACRKLGGWRLVGCTIYVTLEPCPMCAGAIVNARLERVVFGASDAKAGAFGGILDLTQYPFFRPQVTGGVLAEESRVLLSDFFRKKR